MNEAALYRLMAAKWLETADKVEHRGLKRCYARRALSYETMAARYEEEQRRAAGLVSSARPGDCDH